MPASPRHDSAAALSAEIPWPVRAIRFTGTTDLQRGFLSAPDGAAGLERRDKEVEVGGSSDVQLPFHVQIH